MRILGIDGGSSGAFVLYVTGDGLEGQRRVVCAANVTMLENKRPNVAEIKRWIAAAAPDHVFIERAQAMPDHLKGARQGSSSSFNYGRTVGYLECIPQCMGLPVTYVEAAGWKKHFGLLKQPKNASKPKALGLVIPGSPQIITNEPRAEALLIGIFGAVRMEFEDPTFGRAV